MAKYSDDVLREMARAVLAARAANDARYPEFIVVVAARTGTSPGYVEQEIKEYAFYA